MEPETRLNTGHFPRARDGARRVLADQRWRPYEPDGLLPDRSRKPGRYSDSFLLAIDATLRPNRPARNRE